MIRPLRPDDGPAMAAIEPSEDTSGLPRLLMKPAFAGLAFEEDGQMRGFITGWSIDQDGEVIQISVHPDHRRRGIGQELLARFRQDFGRKGCRLEVRADNTIAQRLYRKAGFVEVGRRKGYYPAGPNNDAKNDAENDAENTKHERIDALLMTAKPPFHIDITGTAS